MRTPPARTRESAETALKPQDTNAYGELSFFDESVSVGRTNTKNGFTPYISADSTEYARVVMGNGTTFYTFPAAYVLSEGTIYGSSGKNIYVPDFASLNSAMAQATGTNPNWTKENVYRIELPYTVNRLNGGTQNFGGYSNVVEITLQPNSAVQDADKNCIFWRCYALEKINNLDTFVFSSGSTGGSFQDCSKLTSLTIGVSPNVKDPGENMFSGCTSLVSVNVQEAFPNLTKIGKNMFYNCNALAHFSSNVQYTYVMPTTVTSIDQSAFNSCKAVKYISISPAVSAIGTTAFQYCTSLVFVDFGNNQNVINADSWGMFQGCTSLLAVVLPDNFKLIPNRTFAGCTALKAVHLPTNLYSVKTNNWGEDPFNGCTNLYFVNDKFEVRDENGNFYTETTFQMPAKPNVYYMPNSLTELCINKTSGKCFTSCLNLNPVIVFGTNMTKTTLGDGIFFECGNNGTMGSSITAVFLGDMEQLKVHPRDNRNKGVKYVFANENDKSFSDVDVISNYDGYYALNDKTEGFYFCHSDSYYLFNGVKFKGTYTNDTLTKQEGAVHLYLIAKETAPTCTENGVRGFVCFCGKASEESALSPATGHQKGEFVSSAYPSVNGAPNYFANMIAIYVCADCSENAEFDVENSALFGKKGYSFSENDSSQFSYTIYVNHDAVALYGEGIKYGIFASAVTNGTPLTVVDGNIVGGEKTVAMEMQNASEKYSIIQVKLTNIGEGKELHVGAFASQNNTVTYLTHDSVSTVAEIVSHAILVEKYPSKEDLVA